MSHFPHITQIVFFFPQIASDCFWLSCWNTQAWPWSSFIQPVVFSHPFPSLQWQKGIKVSALTPRLVFSDTRQLWTLAYLRLRMKVGDWSHSLEGHCFLPPLGWWCLSYSLALTETALLRPQLSNWATVPGDRTQPSLAIYAAGESTQ